MTRKIALVTGATRGIGLETVRQLAQAGVHTLLAGRKRDTAVEQALLLQGEGLPVQAIQLDATDAASIAEAGEQAVRTPHPGEFARVFAGTPAVADAIGRLAAARRAAALPGAVVTP